MKKTTKRYLAFLMTLVMMLSVISPNKISSLKGVNAEGDGSNNTGKISFVNTKPDSEVNASSVPTGGIGHISLSLGRASHDSGNIGDGFEFILDIDPRAFEFTNNFGDIDTPFYNALARHFANVTDIIASQPDLYDEFMPKLEDLKESTSDCGWGVYYELSDILDRVRR